MSHRCVNSATFLFLGTWLERSHSAYFFPRLYIVWVGVFSELYGVHIHKATESSAAGNVKDIEVSSHLSCWRPYGLVSQNCSRIEAIRRSPNLLEFHPLQFIDLTKICLPVTQRNTPLLGKATIFSRPDATVSFHQTPLSSACQEPTTFITPIRHFCFTRLPYGITSGSEYFQNSRPQTQWTEVK